MSRYQTESTAHLALAKWRPQAARGRRMRPARMPVQPHRPVNAAYALRDIQIQFTIAVLQKVGAPPGGNPVSGCRIASEALGIPEETIRRIWKERIWARPFWSVMSKYSKAIAERNLPPHTTEA